MNRAQRRAIKFKRKGVIKVPEGRTKETIQSEYEETLKQVGAKTFHKAVLENEIQNLTVRLSDLNKEAIALSAPQATVTPEVIDGNATQG